MPWTAQGELQKLQKGQYLDISTDIPEGEEHTWTHTPWDVQTDFLDKNNKHRNDPSREHNPEHQPKQQQHVYKFQHGSTSGNGPKLELR